MPATDSPDPTQFAMSREVPSLPPTIRVSLASLAKMIDHALLHPTMTDDEVEAGLELVKTYGTATACVKPYSVRRASEALQGSGVLVCPVIGFPHGNSVTEIKVLEAIRAVEDGGQEVDMVINIAKAVGGQWNYVEDEIRKVNEAVVSRGAILKVIFENDYLNDGHIVRLCEICTGVGVAFIKTSTGFGFVKQSNGMYSYKGATMHHLALMKEHAGGRVKIKAAGGVRSLDELLQVMALGVQRVGTSSTASLLDEAKNRGIGSEMVEVKVVPLGYGNKSPESSATSSGY